MNCRASKQKEKTFQRSQLKYVEHFMTTNCAPQLMELKLFPNVKEITETWGCFEASHRLETPFEWNNRDVFCIVVGDGHRPRTGATYAFRTVWTVKSIDPEFHPHRYDVKRLELYKKRVEDCSIDCEGRPTLIVLPHSHATWQNCLSGIRNWGDLAIIALPCCQKFEIPYTPLANFDDMAILSPCRNISVYQRSAN